MLVLALDTSGAAVTAALHDGRAVVARRSTPDARRHAELLAPSIAAVLDEAGASRGDILRFIGWQFARPVLIANLIAWPVTWFFMRRWLDGFAYRVDLGVLAFAVASALALAIALLTLCGHALAVSRARPVEALRYE